LHLIAAAPDTRHPPRKTKASDELLRLSVLAIPTWGPLLCSGDATRRMAESKKQAGGGGRVSTPKPTPQSGVDVEGLSKAVGAR
jgi:hypothetical protein